MVIAKWQGELDKERFDAVLAEPALADPELGPLVTEPAASEAPPTVPDRFRRGEPVPSLT
jgi:aerobic C4-dicarboxylate transport protein